MRPVLLLSAAALAGHATLAGAQKPAPMRHEGIKLTDVAGTWDGKSMVGPKDSVVATFVVTATADGKGWTMKLSDRDPIPTRDRKSTRLNSSHSQISYAVFCLKKKKKKKQ